MELLVEIRRLRKLSAEVTLLRSDLLFEPLLVWQQLVIPCTSL
jgi:hypothetical protein